MEHHDDRYCIRLDRARAVWNKGATVAAAQIEDIENNLPFKILEFDSDNGSEESVH